MELSDVNKCITPEMNAFLKAMAKIAEGYSVIELNEMLETYGGRLKISIGEAATYLEENIGAQNLDVHQNNGSYDITFFVGEIGGKGKNGYIHNIEF